MPEEQVMTTVPQMVDEVRGGKLTRRNLVKILTGLGISTAGAGAVAAAAASQAFTQKPKPAVHAADKQREQNLHLHDQHLAHQQQGNTDGLHSDYAPHAVVEDSMHETPFVGRDAIMQRKSAGIAAIPDLKIDVQNRIAHGPQVMVEWVATGTHSRDFPGLPTSQRTFSIRGVTVVIRHQGKIVRESLYYDMAEVRRQLANDGTMFMKGAQS